MRRSVLVLAAALVSLTPALVFSQTSPGTTTQAPSSAKKSATKSADPLPADQYASEAEAKQRCGTEAVVWMNLSSKVYHPAGSRVYGKTKRGAYMCQANADRAGRAAKASKGKAKEKAKEKAKSTEKS